jgi:hypothetical protein
MVEAGPSFVRKEKAANSFFSLFSQKEILLSFHEEQLSLRLFFLPCGARGIESRRARVWSRCFVSPTISLSIFKVTPPIVASPLVVVVPIVLDPVMQTV